MSDKPPPGFKPWTGSLKRSAPAEDPFAKMRAMLEETKAPAAKPARRLKEAVVMDPSGFQQPVPAARLMIPADWVAQGQVDWVPDYEMPANCAQLSFYARDPSGRLSFNLYPNFAWKFSEGPMGSFGAPPLHAPGYIEQVLLPKVRGHVQAPAVLERSYQKEVAESIQRALVAQLGAIAGTEVQVDAARVKVQYNYQGVQYEEWFQCVMQNLITTMDAPGMGFGAPSVMRSYVLAAERVFSFRAPAGELEANEGLLNTILASVRAEPKWEAAVSQIMRSMNETSAQGAAERSRIRRDAMAEVSRMNTERWKHEQASKDRMHEQYVRTLRGVERWSDPSTGAMLELELGFKSAWRNGLGEIVTSKESTFDANRVFEGSWVRLLRHQD